MLRDTQVPEDRAHDAGIGPKGEDAHLAVTGGTSQRVHLVDARVAGVRPLSLPTAANSANALDGFRNVADQPPSAS